MEGAHGLWQGRAEEREIENHLLGSIIHLDPCRNDGAWRGSEERKKAPIIAGQRIFLRNH